MMKKKLFIASGGYADIPIIKAAKELGYYVITSGHDKNGLGNLYSDMYYPADNYDKEAVLAAAKASDASAICPGAAGLSAITCSYAAEKLGLGGLDSYEVAQILHHKDKFSSFTKAHQILTPKSESFCDLEAANKAIGDFKFPLIIKPTDLSGGKGIVKVSGQAGYKNAIAEALRLSKEKTIVIEEFIEGRNHGFSSIIRDGKVVFYFSDKEYYYLNRYIVAGASTPSDVPESAIRLLIVEIEKIASILCLKNGIFHLQFILNNGRPYIIDICRRIPGDLYVDFVKYATGINYPLFIIKGFLGLNIDDLEQQPASGYFTRHVIMASKNGRIKRIKYDDLIDRNIIDRFMVIKKGDEINDHLNQCVGIVFLRYNSQNEYDDKNPNLNRLIEVEMY